MGPIGKESRNQLTHMNRAKQSSNYLQELPANLKQAKTHILQCHIIWASAGVHVAHETTRPPQSTALGAVELRNREEHRNHA